MFVFISNFIFRIVLTVVFIRKGYIFSYPVHIAGLCQQTTVSSTILFSKNFITITC